MVAVTYNARRAGSLSPTDGRALGATILAALLVFGSACAEVVVAEEPSVPPHRAAAEAAQQSRSLLPVAEPAAPAPPAPVSEPVLTPPPAAAHTATLAGEPFTREELEPLLTRLEADGVPRDVLTQVFYDKRLRHIDRIVTYNVLNPDSARIYEQFLEPFAIKLAKEYRRRHARDLNALQQQYGVSPEVIVGILLVETQFGTAALRYRLLEVFTTLIVDASPAAVDRHYRRLKTDYPDLDKAWVQARLEKKAAWAYDELKALLSIRDKLSVDSLYEVKGSYAGAFGMPQFMPTSYLQWAVDGNRDLRVDLDNPSDAMASIANFLYQHGWRADAPLEQKMRAVWEYNRSMHYVRTIFGVALGMTRPAPKRGSAPAEPGIGPRTAQAGTAVSPDLDAQRIEEAAQHLSANPVLTGGAVPPAQPLASDSAPAPGTAAPAQAAQTGLGGPPPAPGPELATPPPRPQDAPRP